MQVCIFHIYGFLEILGYVDSCTQKNLPLNTFSKQNTFYGDMFEDVMEDCFYTDDGDGYYDFFGGDGCHYIDNDNCSENSECQIYSLDDYEINHNKFYYLQQIGFDADFDYQQYILENCLS